MTALTVLAQTLDVPPDHVLIEGDSLVNDGTALVAYARPSPPRPVAARSAAARSRTRGGTSTSDRWPGSGCSATSSTLSTARSSRLRDAGRISDAVLHAVMRELDLEDQRPEI